MFFSLSQKQEHNFPFHYELPNGLVLSTDDGWRVFNIKNFNIIFKGYANNLPCHKLVEQLLDNTQPHAKGNFCAFISDSNSTRLLHDTNRSFPLWINKNTITNLQHLDEQIWADCVLTVDRDFSINKHYYEPYQKNTQQLTDDRIISH